MFPLIVSPISVSSLAPLPRSHAVRLYIIDMHLMHKFCMNYRLTDTARQIIYMYMYIYIIYRESLEILKQTIHNFVEILMRFFRYFPMAQYYMFSKYITGNFSTTPQCVTRRERVKA